MHYRPLRTMSNPCLLEITRLFGKLLGWAKRNLDSLLAWLALEILCNDIPNQWT